MVLKRQETRSLYGLNHMGGTNSDYIAGRLLIGILSAAQIFDELLQYFMTNVLPDIIDNRIYDILNEVLESRVTDIVNKILNDWISKNLRQYVYGYINDYLKGCPWATLPLSGSEYMWIFQDGQIRKLKISDLGGYIKPVDPQPPTPEIKGSFDDSFDNSFD